MGGPIESRNASPIVAFYQDYAAQNPRLGHRDVEPPQGIAAGLPAHLPPPPDAAQQTVDDRCTVRVQIKHDVPRTEAIHRRHGNLVAIGKPWLHALAADPKSNRQVPLG